MVLTIILICIQMPQLEKIMYVCICRQVTDNQIRDLCREGASDLVEITAKLGVASECGKCGKLARAIVKEFSKAATFINAA
jgi:bacterioferritin-associated ferredoxin